MSQASLCQLKSLLSAKGFPFILYICVCVYKRDVIEKTQAYCLSPTLISPKKILFAEKEPNC